MSQGIFTEELPNGIKLNFIPAVKFKTISLGLFLHQELREDLAAVTALLPAVLERGSRRYPDNLTLRRELERLFGAELSTDIHKKGERHLISCSMEMVHGKYVGEDAGLLRKGMAIMAGVAGDPLVENGCFKKDYVDQEKEQQAKEIRSLINDKATYALEKCIAAMCGNERYGVYKLGRIEDLERIDPSSLWDYYRELIATAPMELYVVGELEREQVLEAAREAFAFDRSPRRDGIPETVVHHDAREVKLHEEKMPVGQAKLVLGYRTNISYRDPLYLALLVYNGVLGAFAHSKLFLNVREKAGLAYYIYSRLERHKGLMIVAAGIEGGDYRKTMEIIAQQAEAMARGEISDLEMENTRRALINHLRTQEDNPYQMINFHLDGAIGGKNYSTGEMIRGIESVGLEEIRAVAGRIRLDTAYLLQGEGQGEEGGAAAS